MNESNATVMGFNPATHYLNASDPFNHSAVNVVLEGGPDKKQAWKFSRHFSIGRHKTADVRIQDETVSRVHAVVYYAEDKWWILDMNSLNGIIIDGQKVHRHPLEAQTRLRLGWEGPRLDIHAINNTNTSHHTPSPIESDRNDNRRVKSTKMRVFLTDGDGEEHEWCFKRGFRIGRHTDVDIRINDAGVSRFHAMVHLRDGKWWIRDMNSANGTFVNGKKIVKQRLGSHSRLQLSNVGPILKCRVEETYHSDRVSNQAHFEQNANNEGTIIHEFDHDAGKRIVMPLHNALPKGGQAPLKKAENDLAGDATILSKQLQKLRNHVAKATPAIKTQLTKWRKYFVVVAPVLLIGFVLVGYGYIHAPDRPPLERDDKIIAKHDENKKTGGHAQNDHADNEPKMDGANTRKVPQDTIGAVKNENTENAKAQKDIDRNQIAAIYFNAAGKFSNHRYWKVALEYYQRISERNPDYPGLEAEMAKMLIESDNQTAYEEGVVHIKDGRLEKGIVCLKRIHDNSVYYAEARETIAQAVQNQERQTIAKAQANEAKKAKTAINRALQYYAAGKIDASLQKLDHVVQAPSRANHDLKSRAKTLKKRIEYSKALYDKGTTEYADGRHDLAIDTWKRFIEVDNKLLSGKDGFFAKSVRKKMADEFGSMALKAHSDGNLPTAYKYSEMALEIKINHAISLEVKQMLQAKSKQLFQEGYILEEYNPEKALEKWKKILHICAPTSEYYKKALIKIGAR